MKINILGTKKPDSETLELKKLDGLSFKVSDSYNTLGEDTLNEAEFDQGDMIEITLNDKIKLHLSATSFQTLFPKHSKNSSLNLIDCDLQTHDMSSQTNLINILMHSGEYSWSNVYDTAIQKLNHLTDIAPNSYRFELLGEAYKNKALLLADKVSLVEIDAMQEAYANARIITEIKTGLLEPSSALNYLLATVAKSMLELKQANSVEYKHWIDQLCSIFFQLKLEDKALQSAINVLDNELVTIFLDASLVNKEYEDMDTIKDQLTALSKAYQRVLEYFDPDDSERSSCMRNVSFLYQVSEKIRSAQGHEINQLLMILSRAGVG